MTEHDKFSNPDRDAAAIWDRAIDRISMQMLAVAQSEAISYQAAQRPRIALNAMIVLATDAFNVDGEIIRTAAIDWEQRA